MMDKAQRMTAMREEDSQEMIDEINEGAQSNNKKVELIREDVTEDLNAAPEDKNGALFALNGQNGEAKQRPRAGSVAFMTSTDFEEEVN